MTDAPQLLTFDNVRPSSLTLAELLAGTWSFRVFDDAGGEPPLHAESAALVA